ncbi:ATP-dependent DNA helicase UvrD1 [bacterium HR15]|nr:ATP-dependent DNA helicase UvrD1 [bacterium HR15]
MRLTPVQQRAIEFGEGRLVLVAGAGAGKTGVLTERFVHLVSERGVDPERILTITFTRNATAEMKARIIRQLEWRGLHDARHRIESAYIHTVHALCRRLLQENPFEAGIEPDPTVLSAPASHQLRTEAFHRALDHLLSMQSQAAEQEALHALIAEYLMLGDTAVRGDPLQTLYRMVGYLVDESRHQGLALPELLQWLSEETFRSAGASPASEDRQEAHAQQLQHALLRLSCEYLAQYQQLKEEQGTLDFDDLQLRAVQMLRSSATVRHRYQQRFQYLLVDEAQDIDPLQAELIELLTGEQGNLMVVGDGQQSIYGFRFADLRVFRNWQAKASCTLEMHDNFRSRPEILAFVRFIFAHLWGDAFLPPQHARPSLPADEGHEEPHVQVWRWARREPDAEAALIAGTIRQWVANSSLPVHDMETNALRPARYGDFALLFHQYTAVERYEQQFQQIGVPCYVVGGGRGYYLRYEVRDLANLLRALTDLEDEVALLSLLRSPMVGLSLDALMLLVDEAQRWQLPLRLALNDPPSDLPPEDTERLMRFLGWFGSLEREVGRRSVGWLLARALEASAYEARLLRLPDGKQQVANVRKLLALAIGQPAVHPQAFAAQLDALVRAEQREGNAPTFEESADVVRFYTVHGAKGLEFPVVFLADTGYRERARDLPIYVEPLERRMGLRLRNGYETTTYRELRDRHRQEEIAEAQRKLYVALTRARDYLIVNLTMAGNPWARGLMGALSRYLNQPRTRHHLPDGTPFLWKEVSSG